MPEMSKPANYDYDNNVFHSHSSNIPHLFTWIDELIAMTENELPLKTFPATIQLVESIHRYDTCVRELLRQTSVFSDNLTRMYAKVWIGVLNLLEYMVKLYHRHVKQTFKLQEDAQKLVNDRQTQLISSKFKQEESELEQTSLRARVRNLEGELEATLGARSILENENIRLRALIDQYINGSEFQDESLQPSDLLLPPEDKHLRKPRRIPPPKQEDLGPYPLQDLVTLDLEMTSVLSNVVREEDRQRVLISDLENLIQRNSTIFGTSSGPVTRVGRRGLNADTALKVDIGIQADDKDVYYAVDELPMYSPMAKDSRLRMDRSPYKVPLSRAPHALEIPYQIRKKMTRFPTVLRLPPIEWLMQSILSIYLDKIYNDEHLSSLGREKMPLPDYVYEYFTRMYGLNTITDIQMIQLIKCCENHPNNKRVALFARQIGLEDKENAPELDMRDTDFVLSVIAFLVREGQFHPANEDAIDKNSIYRLQPGTAMLSSVEMPRTLALTMASAIFDKWVSDGAEDFIRKIGTMYGTHKGTKFILVDDFINAAIDQWMNVRHKWSEHLRYLFKMHALVYRVMTEVQFTNDNGATDKDAVLVQVSKDAAEDCPRRHARLFMRPDLVMPLKPGHNETTSEDEDEDSDEHDNISGPGSDDGDNDTSPNTPLVMNDVIAKEDNDNASVSVSVSVSGSAVVKFDKEATSPKQKASLMMNETLGDSLGAVPISRNNSNVNMMTSTTPVTELLNKRGFIAATQDILPKIKKEEMDLLFQAACDYSTALSDRALEKMWTTVKGVDGKVAYLNNRSGLTQRTPPYRESTFRCYDVFEEAFVAVALQHDLLAKSPLLEYLHISPKDMWPNCDMFHKQARISRSAHGTRDKPQSQSQSHSQSFRKKNSYTGP